MENLTSYYYTPQRLPPPPPTVSLHRLPHHHHDPLPPSPPVSLDRLDHHHTYLPPPHSPPYRDGDDEVLTLFIAGLPEDVKNREIYHIFLEFPGFLRSNLLHPSGDAQVSAAYTFLEWIILTTTCHLSVDHRGIFDTSAAASNNSISSNIAQDRSPCSTIFVANLGPKRSEQELQQVFSRCRGFLKLKFQRSHRSPVAFVDFQDTACSTDAMIQLQGTVLRSSPAGEEGMHLDYAKSRMVTRRKKSK